MSAVSHPAEAEPDWYADLTDLILLVLVAIYGLVGATSGGLTDGVSSWAGLLAVPVGVVTSRWAVALIDHQAARIYRAGWPFLASPAVYLSEVHVVAHGPRNFVDDALRRTDVWLGLHEGRPDWALGTGLEELANLAYLSYYAIPLIGLWVGIRWGPRALAQMALGLAATTVFCGLVWLVFPSGGYHPTGAPTSPAPGPATEAVRWIYRTNPHYAAAFPSQHVGHAAVVVAVLRRRGVNPALWLWVLAIWAATVYGQYHYAIDGLAGALVGAGAGTLAMALGRPAR